MQYFIYNIGSTCCSSSETPAGVPASASSGASARRGEALRERDLEDRRTGDERRGLVGRRSWLGARDKDVEGTSRPRRLSTGPIEEAAAAAAC